MNIVPAEPGAHSHTDKGTVRIIAYQISPNTHPDATALGVKAISNNGRYVTPCEHTDCTAGALNIWNMSS